MDARHAKTRAPVSRTSHRCFVKFVFTQKKGSQQSSTSRAAKRRRRRRRRARSSSEADPSSSESESSDSEEYVDASRRSAGGVHASARP